MNSHGQMVFPVLSQAAAACVTGEQARAATGLINTPDPLHINPQHACQANQLTTFKARLRKKETSAMVLQ